ncbi:MAG: hypothetical protein J5825_00945 [Lachnospiraceae bacterium]|nr:hypothetical protein [Lachnospiraceae bacterium]
MEDKKIQDGNQNESAGGEVIKKAKGRGKASKFSAMTLCRILGILAGVVVLLLFCLKVGETIRYGKFYGKAKKEFSIAGLDDGLTVQGIDLVTEVGKDDKDQVLGNGAGSLLSTEGCVFLESGYMKDESTSRIYRVNTGRKLSANNKDYLLLCDEKGTPSKTHAGGLTSSREMGKVWVCGAGTSVLVYDLNTVMNSGAGSEITALASFEVPMGSAYCFYDGTYLWVGEFYREQNYPTDPSHHLQAAGGVLHHSLILGYPADPENPGNVKTTPEVALSIPDLVQGMAVDKEGRIYLSSSYAVASSHLSIYKNVLAEDAKDRIEIDGQEIPLYFLDESTILKQETLPPMSEDLCMKGDRVCIMNESATQKYLFGRLLHGKYVYSYKMEN